MNKVAKRVFDIFLASLGLAALWPVSVAIAIVIKLDDSGPVFYRQERVGFRGKSFRIWKFRTMVVDSDRLGKQITVGQDPRITPVGRLLRKTKLDELPQLINVLLGEMSFVGPRPEVPEYVAYYTPEQRQVLDLMPGITDEASIAYRNESEILAEAENPEQTYLNEVMPRKIEINLAYADHASVIRDLLVILRTISRLLNP